MELPEELRAALDDACSAYSTKELAAAAQRLSDRYRGLSATQRAPGKTLETPDTLNARSAVAYAAARLPAAFAATAAALHQARLRIPAWRPQSLLDVGAGLGAGLWAAQAEWPDLEQATLLERAPQMIALGKQLCAAASASTIREARWREADVTGEWGATERAYDLVVAGYLLGELAAPPRERLIERLWEKTAGALALIAPGTPTGFAHIHAARSQLLAAGATILAPCPHDGSCPIRPLAPPDEEPTAVETNAIGPGQAGNWCHFTQRLARSRLHRQLKGGELAYEDEKFSYVIAVRPGNSALPAAPIEGRIVRHPQTRPGVVTLEVCAREGGLERRIIPRREREAFRRARDLRWGDALE